MAKLTISERNTKAQTSLTNAASTFTKMKITPYEVIAGQRQYFEYKIVKINPESYTRKLTPLSCGSQKTAAGTKQEKKLVEFSETISFDLWFDNTGAIPDTEDVTTSIKWIEDNLVKYDGNIHSTRFVKLYWGTLSFWGQLKSIDIQYMLFSRNGEPLRAKASLSFENIIEPKLREQERKKKSPDLTHMRIVQAGDNLPLMCFKIYKDPSYYLKVAEANGLSNFTDIRPGQKIYFPPLKS